MSNSEPSQIHANSWFYRNGLRALIVAGAPALAALLSGPAAAQSSVGGFIGNTATNAYGVQLYLNSGASPSVCSGTANQGGWMIVPAANKPMISVALIAAALGTQVTLYSDGSVTVVGSAKYCNVVQIVSALR